MNKKLYDDALQIINYSIREVLPEKAVRKALEGFVKPNGKTIMVSIGKAAYSMAKETLNNIDIDIGLVITKYNHAQDALPNTTIIEAGHPILDENSLKGTQFAIDLCQNLTCDDTVVMLISGGGSALFEMPLVSLEELQDISSQLLKCGANINEINIIRKRLSKVKGGRFAKICEPAKVINIILSDIINDPLDMIASGPTCPDLSTCQEALDIVNKYHLNIKKETLELLKLETIKNLDNIVTYITGNNEQLKLAAKRKALQLGYETIYIDEAITSEAKDAASFMIEQIEQHKNHRPIAIIAGGEIVVEVKGNGLGGRNQELSLRCAPFIKDKDICFFAIGSDGTDGPTDAAGAYCDSDTCKEDIETYSSNNDSYHYFEKYGGLIKTRPTGTNVCDLYVALLK